MHYNLQQKKDQLVPSTKCKSLTNLSLPASSEHVQCFVQIKIKMTMEVSTNKLVYFVLALCVEILKLMKISSNIETIGGEDVWLPLD